MIWFKLEYLNIVTDSLNLKTYILELSLWSERNKVQKRLMGEPYLKTLSLFSYKNNSNVLFICLRKFKKTHKGGKQI